MSDANIDLVKQSFEHFAVGNIEGFLAALADGVTWDHSGPEVVPFNRVYQGREAVGSFFELVDQTSEKLVFEPHEFFAAEDVVVVLGHFKWTVRATGKQWDSDWAMRFTVRIGAITHWKIIFDKGAEAAAFSSK